ncbi:ABC transporter substrate-binding protein [Salinibacterium sp. SYSU T00001]|uniref:ABC transporter substrate-binding protein n=1 Tax=Homoserinimonas sedimenticola TaxID=2986805 RepID=UPI0022363338|nr:ABC transporter substrate-binding protein [Salinibacterium sedimenticola]MCW4386044.1 ABC transporter substrate-binding protein [Salinibacterium sedimenticola]
MKTSAIARAIVVIGVAAASVTACSPQGVGANGTTELTIGALPSVESAPLFLGQEEGFFADEGLNIRIAALASGTGMLIDPVVSGTYDIAVSDMLSILSAQEDGADLRLLAPAGSATGDPTADFGALVVNNDSTYTTLSDLEGAFVGSNSTGDTNNTVLRAIMDAEAGFSYTVQWKEVPFQSAASALSDGTVDAAFLVEPYLTRALNGDKRVLSYTYSAFDPSLDVNAYFTSARFANERPEVLERFMAALERSIEYAAENPSEVRSVMTSYAETQWNERTAAVLPRYTTSFDLDAAAHLSRSAVKYLVLKSEPDFDALIID